MLTLLANNQLLTPKDFLNTNYEKIGKKETPLKQKKDIFYQAMSIGKKIGVIKDYSEYPITFRDFTSLETIHYFTEQLRQDKRKNTKWDVNNLSPTQKPYFLYIIRLFTVNLINFLNLFFHSLPFNQIQIFPDIII
ncbi:MAG: hypothetical protein MJK05_05090 [Nitrosopumilus sp.]|nr:hypothetical protein [Nitrosopumilus sp.]